MLINKKQAIELLKQGKVIGVPTDTVYGFAAAPNFIEKLYIVKKRSIEKKIVKLIGDMSYIHNADDILLSEMKKNWPGAVTYIYEVNSQMESFRMPNEDNLMELLVTFNDYLWVTSANITGEPPCLTSEEFEQRFPDIPLLKEEIKINKSHIPSQIYIYKDGNFERKR